MPPCIKRPPDEVLREDVLNEARKYFEEHPLESPSELDIQSILLPKKQPLAGYPKFSVLLYSQQIYTRNRNESNPVYAFFFTIIVLLCVFSGWMLFFSLCCWCNLKLFLDCRYAGPHIYRDSVCKNIFILYKSVYESRLIKTDGPVFCACLEVMTAFRSSFILFHHFKEEKVVLESLPDFMYNVIPSNKKFVVFRIGNILYHNTRNVFEILENGCKNWDIINSI
eukprot:snap_masked-scaffold_14-processed-gene-11.0-mRNA-1 protein AED:1.00 eAED:1.00 QI:0/0/0/0/1/1/2/0/223